MISNLFKRQKIGSLQKRGRLLALVAGIVFIIPSAATGYVLQGPHVLELMVSALSGPRTLRVEQQVIIDDREIADHSVTLKETLSFVFPDRFRSDTWYADTYRMHVEAEGKSLTVIDGRQVPGPSKNFDRYKDLFLPRSRFQLHKMLLTHGVDVEKSSLGRFEETMVYVLGAQYPEESVSQVWVDGERFLPVRWLLVSASGGVSEHLDFIYREWQKHGEQWYPGRIDTYHNQHLIRQLDIRAVQAGIDLPAELFDLSRLKDLYPLPDPADIPDTMEFGDDKYQKIIEETLQQYSVR